MFIYFQEWVGVLVSDHEIEQVPKDKFIYSWGSTISTYWSILKICAITFYTISTSNDGIQGVRTGSCEPILGMPG